MDMKKKQSAFGEKFSIWTIVKYYYAFAKYFGLAPYEIEGPIESGKIKFSLWYTCFFVAALGLQSVLVYVNFKMDLSLSKTNSFLIDKGAHFVEILNVFDILLSTVINAIFRKKIWSCFRRCHEFDEEVNVK